MNVFHFFFVNIKKIMNIYIFFDERFHFFLRKISKKKIKEVHPDYVWMYVCALRDSSALLYSNHSQIICVYLTIRASLYIYLYMGIYVYIYVCVNNFFDKTRYYSEAKSFRGPVFCMEYGANVSNICLKKKSGDHFMLTNHRAKWKNGPECNQSQIWVKSTKN